jgi:transglutaminase-like putative cysteine protease
MQSMTTNVNKRDWILYILALAAVMTLPLSIEQAGWAPEAKGLLYVAFFGSLLGVLLARSPLPAWLSWLVGLLVGAQYSLQYAGRLLPTANVILRDAGQAVAWLWQAIRHGAVGSQLPFAQTGSHFTRQLGLMVGNLTQWVQAVQAGSPTKDTTTLVFGVCLITWILAWHTAYELFRGRRTFVGLLPLGAAVVANVSFTDIGMAYVNFYLFVTMLILVWSNAGRMETVWARLGLDFSPELRRDALVAGSTISGIILVVALVMPYFVYARAIFWFWDHYGTGITSFYDRLDIAFAGRNPVPEPTAKPKGLAEHAVGSGGGSLGSSTVFSVVTSDLPPPTQEEMEMWGDVDLYQWVAKHYWRERTYDAYTGHGWDTSERQNTSWGANAPWNEISYPHTILTQTYTIRNPGGDLAFGVNEPVSVDRAYRTLTRGQDDLAALMLTAPQYTVVSAIPDMTVDALRLDEGAYPTWVQERYLPLPRIPERVQQKAEEVVREAGATTRFDKARAIELYLRMFPYDLELEPPPLDQDVVDYFLFTAERGYCDYSASAMVVMLRAVGVAARYASGYAMGEYDHYAAAWVVSERDAHAWAEVYFPEYGWIEFEPTPAQATFTRLGGGSDWGLNRPFLPTPTPAQGRVSPFWLGAGALLLIVAFVIVWPPRWFRRRGLPPREQVLRVYERLLSRVRWFGLSPWSGQTVRQYMHYLVQQIELRIPSAYGAREDIMLIMSTYERARYGDAPLNEEEYHRVEAAWRRLRATLTRLLFTRAPSFEMRQPSLAGDLSSG